MKMTISRTVTTPLLYGRYANQTEKNKWNKWLSRQMVDTYCKAEKVLDKDTMAAIGALPGDILVEWEDPQNVKYAKEHNSQIFEMRLKDNGNLYMSNPSRDHELLVEQLKKELEKILTGFGNEQAVGTEDFLQSLDALVRKLVEPGKFEQYGIWLPPQPMPEIQKEMKWNDMPRLGILVDKKNVTEKECTITFTIDRVANYQNNDWMVGDYNLAHQLDMYLKLYENSKLP